MESTIAQPLTLKCGLQLKNRLVKAAMAECMADDHGLPTALHNNVYREWGNGGWGMILTGNVNVDKRYLADARDNTVDPSNKTEFLAKWRILAEACTKNGTPAIMQINHPGRQSPLGAGSRGFFEKNIAPSAIPLNLGPGLLARFSSSFVFGTPRHMTQADIDLVIKQFVECSRLAYEAGLQGVEIHAAHGYLLAQFLSADSNHRTDRYGGSVENRARLIIEIICAVRNAVPASFCVGVKLNSVDHQSRKALAACVIQLKMIVGTGIDFVEISGGTYEDPQMMQAAVQPQGEKSSHTLAREAFFLEFASVIRNEVPNISLLLTGGFRTRKGIAGAIKDDACDMAGIARPAALQPSLPNSVILNGKVPDEEARFIGNPFSPSWLVKISGQRAGAEFKWYSEQIQERGRQRQV